MQQLRTLSKHHQLRLHRGIIMDNSKLIKWAVGLGIVTAITTTTLVMAQTSKGGSVSKQRYSQMIIDMPDGDLRPLLAVAVEEGEARGRLTGAAAKQVEAKFGVGHTVMVKVLRTQEMINGCPKVIAKYYEEGSQTQYEVPIKVCAKNGG